MEMCVGVLNLSSRNAMDTGAEEALIDRCRKQDVEAFGRFVDLYQNRVYGFVRRMVPNSEEAADVTQEVFIRAFQSFVRFDGRSNVRTWLFRIAHNLCIDRARKASRSLSAVSLSTDSDDAETYEVADSRWEPEALILDRELIHVIESSILEMSEKLRTVLLLHDREELSYDEIADTIGIPVGTVKSRLFLARSHLQKSITAYMNGGSHDG
jgi:RNA polymerase sigma-70 factor (ECF subfamily)